MTINIFVFKGELNGKIIVVHFFFCWVYIDFCRLLITFTNNLDPDQDRQNNDPDLDPNGLTP